jgi:hypothetical protein
VVNHHGLRVRARLEGDIGAPRLPRGQGDVGQGLFLKSRRGEREGIGADVDIPEGIISSRVGGHGAGGSGSTIGEGYLGALHDGAARVMYRAQNGAVGGLCRGVAERNDKKKTGNEQAAGYTKARG